MKTKMSFMTAAVVTALMAVMPMRVHAFDDGMYANPKQAFTWYTKSMGCIHLTVLLATPQFKEKEWALSDATFSVVDEKGQQTSCFFVSQEARTGSITTGTYENKRPEDSELFLTNSPEAQPRYLFVHNTTCKVMSTQNADGNFYAEIDWFFPISFAGKKMKLRVDGKLWYGGTYYATSWKADYKKEIGPIDFGINSFETYDIIPGVESGDDGTVKIPFSCDRPVNWVEASYTDEDGNKITLPHILMEPNTYSGFIRLPATGAHRNLQITANIRSATWTDNPAGLGYPTEVNGSVTKTIASKDDAVMHAPRQLTAEMNDGISTGQRLTDAGAVTLKWITQDMKIRDIIEGDPFLVQRSLTGKISDFETIGSVMFSQSDSVYQYKDSTLIDALKEEHIDRNTGSPLVRYRVLRASTQQLWSMEKNPTVIYVQPQISTLTLLTPHGAQAAWSNQTEKKVKVTWKYYSSFLTPMSRHYVWDKRAQMKLEVMSFQLDGTRVDSLVTTLTDEQIEKKDIEIQLQRSCVRYKMRLLVEGGTSPIGKGTGKIFTVLTKTADFIRYAEGLRQMSIGNETDVAPNAIMMNNMSMDGDENASHYLGCLNGGGAPYTGNFNGNGYSLMVEYNNPFVNGIEALAPIMHAADGAVICNLTTRGTITSKHKYAAGIVGQLDKGTLFIENCLSYATLNMGMTKEDCASGGLVGHCVAGTTAPTALFINNSLADGYIGPDNAQLGGFGGFVGPVEPGVMTLVANCYQRISAGTHTLDGDVEPCYSFVKSNNPLLTVVRNSRYKAGWDINQGLKSQKINDNSCWYSEKPVIKRISFSTPESGSIAAVNIVEQNALYYESLGKIDKTSLKVQTRQSSVVLTWTNVDDMPVDYYEVWRCDQKKSEFERIATKITDMQYEDKTTSPVHRYNYYVRGVNDCQGQKYEDTEVREGYCVETGMVEGYLRFPDGTGIPGVEINITSKDGSISEKAITDESGYFKKSGLPYFNSSETTYTAAPNLNGFSATQPVTFLTEPGGNMVSGVVFVVEKSVKFSGYVQFDGTSIPVQGATFLVDGREVHTATGKVESDHEGKFSFRMLEGDHSIQAVKDGHVFYQDGYYHEDDDVTKTKYHFGVDKAGVYFYDKTRVKLIGRVAGGKEQGAIPLGNSLSRNNLGDELQIVLTLEGDNSSRLVWDVLDTKKKVRDEEFRHKAHDKKYEYMTKVHTTLNRMVITPDVHTGEYEVMLPPVKWKVQQITAKGYPTLFQEGQMGDVIDLTDSLTLHKDHIEGSWQNANKDAILSVDVEYNAKYSRIYHSPVIIEYKQQVYDNFDYLGDRYYNARNILGESSQVPLCYPRRKKNWPEGKKDSLEAVYVFGHPVFSVGRDYTLTISAKEKYFYNNNTKSDTVDAVPLPGGTLTIHNGMVSSIHRDVVTLNDKGEVNYILRAEQTPYILTGKDAVRTISMTLLQDGVNYETTPLETFVMNQYAKPGAKEILTINRPLLIDVLRDPPGGGSSAKLSKGSTLKYAHDYNWDTKFGLDIKTSAGISFDTMWGVGNGFAYAGYITSGGSVFTVDVDLIWTLYGKEAWSYTITNNVDISTSSDPQMVGAGADVYIGTETSYILTPTVAVRAIPEKMWVQQEGMVEAGRTVEIARGYSAKGDTLHLVRDEILNFGPKVNSTFAHTQKYITSQLIPDLNKECQALMFTGTKAQAQAIADASQENVYLSLRDVGDPDFGKLNTKKKVTLGNTGWEYYHNTTKEEAEDGINYLIVRPTGNSNTDDKVAEFCQSMLYWAAMIAQNEKEKLEATELVKSFDVDGGAPISYSEEFTSEYSSSGEIKNAWDGTQMFQSLLSSLGRLISNFTHGVAEDDLPHYNTSMPGMKWQLTFGPVLEYNVRNPWSDSKKYNRKESFTISMDKKSHLVFDVFRVQSKLDEVKPDASGRYDVFTNSNFNTLTPTVVDEVIHTGKPTIENLKKEDLRFPKGFVYRTRGGATCRPYEGERKTMFYHENTVLDERTKKIENPVIRMDKQSVSGVPMGEPARFKLYLANESEQPEAVYPYFDLYLVESSNPKGAKLYLDGMPLTGNPRTVDLVPGMVTTKTLEVYAAEDFDYTGLTLSLYSQNDLKTYQEVSFDVHYQHTAGSVTISTPGDKWIMNTDAPFEKGKGWYMPVVISGFNKNQHNFDHIEFQYKESTRGDDYWTNLCGFYADSTLYVAASGTKEMIPDNGSIVTRFFGEGQVMEKAYDLRAVLFCRNGNAFLTNASKVLSGVKDTRRPQLFGTPDPKDGVLGAGENVTFHFSENIEYNYLQPTTNFEVKGETNETAVQEAPSLQFSGIQSYAQSDARRNFNDKNLTIEVMIKPDATSEAMPIFSHGTDGKKLQLWLNENKCLVAVVDNKTLESKVPITSEGFQRVALVLDNSTQKLSLFSKNLDATFDDVSYSGYGPIIFGATNETDVTKRKCYKGRMLQGRVWNRAMDITLLNSYGNQLLTGYEMGLTDYYPMNEGSGSYASDQAMGGAHLKLNGTDWAQPHGMSLKLDWNDPRPVKGRQLKEQFFQRTSEQDYTLMFWFKTNESGRGALLCNGSGRKTDVGAEDKFYIGFEGQTLKYRSNGREYPLGNNYSDGRWHHYAMTVNRGHQVASIYVDNSLKAQFPTDSLGGMTGKFYLGNMVWQEEGPDNDKVHQQNALTGYLDGIALFEQVLPVTLIRRYNAKSPGGEEKGLITYLDFEQQQRQKNGELRLVPYVLNKKVKFDSDGKPTEKHDSVFVDPISVITGLVDENTGAPVQAYEELRNLNFSYVGRDNQILVNIDELDKRINKRTVYVTTSDIPDLNGNFMASPATVSVFVDRNPLRWESKVHKATISGTNVSDAQFQVNISNNSGASHTYTVEHLPKWLSVDVPTDVIDAKEEKTLTFTIGKDANVGTYDDIIYLTDENDLSEPLALNITVEGMEPGWYVDDAMKQFSMNIVARVQIGDDIVTDSRDIVGVFDNMGRCMGVGNINYEASSAESLTYLSVYDSTTVAKPVNFRLWHYNTGKTMALTPATPVVFKPETFVGTTKEPLVLTANDQYIQSIDLYPGWNWISLNVINNDYRDVKKLLSLFKWQEGDMLTDETNNVSLLYHDKEWISNRGSTKLDKLMLSVAHSYRVKVANDVKVELVGSAIKTEGDRTIKVKHGWNSIGYTPLVNLPVTTALASYLDEAEDGDVIKNKTTFAMFSKGANGAREWKGNLKYMKPGEGYMLYRKNASEVTFIYPFYEANVLFYDDANKKRAARVSEYSGSMSLVAAAEGIELEEGDKLIALSGAEVRGVADAAEDGSLFYLSIEGDTKAALSFAIERDGEIIATTDEVMTYERNAISGSPDQPTSISFVKQDDNTALLPQRGWYSVQGVKLPGAPKRKGLYIYNGRKILIN